MDTLPPSPVPAIFDLDLLVECSLLDEEMSEISLQLRLHWRYIHSFKRMVLGELDHETCRAGEDQNLQEICQEIPTSLSRSMSTSTVPFTSPTFFSGPWDQVFGDDWYDPPFCPGRQRCKMQRRQRAAYIRMLIQQLKVRLTQLDKWQEYLEERLAQINDGVALEDLD